MIKSIYHSCYGQRKLSSSRASCSCYSCSAYCVCTLLLNRKRSFSCNRSASVVPAATHTHALVCLHRSHCHYTCMATWILYRELNRTSFWPPVLNLLWGHDCSDSTDAPHGAPRRFGSTQSSGMLFHHQEQPVQFKTLVCAVGSMSHVSGPHTSMALVLFLPSILHHFIIADTHTFTYQPIIEPDWFLTGIVSTVLQ